MKTTVQMQVSQYQNIIIEIICEKNEKEEAELGKIKEGIEEVFKKLGAEQTVFTGRGTTEYELGYKLSKDNAEFLYKMLKLTAESTKKSVSPKEIIDAVEMMIPKKSKLRA